MSHEVANPWDAEADRFDEAPDHGLREAATRQAWTQLLADVLPAPPARVVDLGCGTGTLSVLLSDLGHRVHGVDSSAPMLERARGKSVEALPRPTFGQADVERLPFVPASFDVVLARHVVWALSDPAAALSRWVDLLVPGGRLVLIEGRWDTGAGLREDELADLVSPVARLSRRRALDDPGLWGRAIDDERYLMVAHRDV
jgi:SAM-dependent methyltransferase